MMIGSMQQQQYVRPFPSAVLSPDSFATGIRWDGLSATFYTLPYRPLARSLPTCHILVTSLLSLFLLPGHDRLEKVTQAAVVTSLPAGIEGVPSEGGKREKDQHATGRDKGGQYI